MSRDELRENMMVAVDTLRANKGRSMLTILGIVIGVTSVIAVAAIITGLNRFVQQRVERLGSRTFFLMRINMMTRFGKLPEALRKRKYLDYTDSDYLRSVCPSLESVSPFNTRMFFLGQNNDIRYGSERVERIFLRGAGPEYADALEMFQAETGRFISRYDEEHSRQVVVIGKAIADSLFPSTNPLGKTVRLNGKLYEVIGVMARDEGSFGGGGVDQFAIIPLSDFKKLYPESKELAIGFTVARDVPAD